MSIRMVMVTVIIVSTAVIGGTSCVVSPSTGGGELYTGDPSADVWIVGDSIGYGTGNRIPNVYNAAVGGSGFLVANSVLANTLNEMTEHGEYPETMILIAGVNDKPRFTDAQIIFSRNKFINDMGALGIDVLIAEEPWWSKDLTVLNAEAQIHCGPDTWGGSHDGIHPASYLAYAACVSAQFP